VTRPAPGALVRVVGRKLLDHMTVFLNYEDLLTAVAAKSFGKGDRHEATPTATGARVVAI